MSSTQSAAFFFSPLFPFPSSFRSWCDSALEAPAEPTALREWITSLMLPRAVHADAECGNRRSGYDVLAGGDQRRAVVSATGLALEFMARVTVRRRSPVGAVPASHVSRATADWRRV